MCVVARLAGPCVDLDEVGAMYRIRFDDGVETDAFADELTTPED